MEILLRITLFFVVLLQFVGAKDFKVVCFFDSSNPSNIAVGDLDNALDSCTHFIYGFATLTPRFHTLSFDGSVARTVPLTDVAPLKKKYPNVKFLLSLGGDRDIIDSPKKYLQLLEATTEEQDNFIRSALSLLRIYQFDGLDLAYQFPRNQAVRDSTGVVQFWTGVRKLFEKNDSQTSKANEHKKLFTNFVRRIRAHFQAQNILLTLSVLPNVEASDYFDIPSLDKHLDFVNLWLFDFHSPARNPKKADHPAPLISPSSADDGLMNINSQVHYWLSQNVTDHKLILAIPSYGRTWKIPMRSHRDSTPTTSTPMQTCGPSGTGEESQTPGWLNWLEICDLLKNRTLVVHGSYDYGLYFVYPGNENFTYDSWIGYDGPNVAQYKALYAQQEHLGGVALVDVSMDDYRGVCTGLKFPILKYMNPVSN